MALKIKEGFEINPYNQAKGFTSESKLTQDVLEYLKNEHPDAIEDDSKQKKDQKKED